MQSAWRVQLDSAGTGRSATWGFSAAPAIEHVVAGAEPLKQLERMQEVLKDFPGARWVGYVGYDLGRWFERLPERAVDDVGMPLFEFTLHAPAGPAGRRVDESRWIKPPENRHALGRERGLRSTFSADAYRAAVARAIEYIGAGDVFQVNLSQRFTTGLVEDPWVIYERLREKSPAAYGAFLDYGNRALICNSPELFLRVTILADGRRKVITRPIKGTRPRAHGMEEELRRSVKDQAELNMIVDLERNDLGRVCEVGTIKVSELRTIEAHSTVYHGVATVEGILREDVGLVELLRATFPGGSVTGAPKIRAMEIIEELEPVRRGPYCGAIGYIAADGSMEFNVAIRTMIVKEGVVHVPVGGGIVADSKPAEEYEETIVKARAMFDALGVATR